MYHLVLFLYILIFVCFFSIFFPSLSCSSIHHIFLHFYISPSSSSQFPSCLHLSYFLYSLPWLYSLSSPLSFPISSTSKNNNSPLLLLHHLYYHSSTSLTLSLPLSLILHLSTRLPSSLFHSCLPSLTSLPLFPFSHPPPPLYLLPLSSKTRMTGWQCRLVAGTVYI